MNRIHIRQWLLKHQINKFALDSDDKINVFQDVNLSSQHLKMLPIEFGIVYGNFDISYNQLTSLIGFPEVIHGFLNASHNQLTRIDFLPHEVLNKMDFSHNQIKTLNLSFIPKEVKKLFLHNNLLETIDEIDNKVEILTLFHNLFTHQNLFHSLDTFKQLAYLTTSTLESIESMDEQIVYALDNEQAIAEYKDKLYVHFEKQWLEQQFNPILYEEKNRGNGKI